MCAFIYAESAISGSVPNQEFCFPKDTGKTGGILDWKTASEMISIETFSLEEGGGGHTPRPSYLLCELAFFTIQICAPPPTKKSSYIYANYHLTQAI